MVKQKYNFVCQSCGYTSAKWLGRCPECGAWDSLVEEAVATKTSQRGFLAQQEKVMAKTLASVVQKEEARLTSGIREFDRVLGGGIVPGSLIILGGTPGIGKSTILLDVALRCAQANLTTFYVSGEESEGQTALRARRLGGNSEKLLIMTATDLDVVLEQAQKLAPRLLIIDSIQTMYNSELPTAAGSVGQVRECTAKLLQFAKGTGIAVFIIGHVTKDGTIAGPRLLEHMVDVVLQFEGDRSYSFRVLRALKNRFGSTNESGIFSMEAGGLKEVANPAGLFLEDRESNVSGSIIGACLEGNRPIMAEFQALVSKTPFGMPRRTAVGCDYNRVNMLLAVLQRHLKLDFGSYDAYVNLVGGMKTSEPAADLPLTAALVSSLQNRAVACNTLTFGEVGLTGEVRRVAAPERRILEGAALGFKRFIVPNSKLELPRAQAAKLQILQVRTLAQALQAIFQA